jgi:hypothetical protein
VLQISKISANQKRKIIHGSHVYFYQIKQDRIKHVLQKTPHKPFLQSSVPIESEFFEEIIKL